MHCIFYDMVVQRTHKQNNFWHCAIITIIWLLQHNVHNYFVYKHHWPNWVQLLVVQRSSGMLKFPRHHNMQRIWNTVCQLSALSTVAVLVRSHSNAVSSIIVVVVARCTEMRSIRHMFNNCSSLANISCVMMLWYSILQYKKPSRDGRQYVTCELELWPIKNSFCAFLDRIKTYTPTKN